MSEKGFPKTIQVVAYSGYKANERPLHFLLNDVRREVIEILDRSVSEEYDQFRLAADDGKIYSLRWHRLRDEWSVMRVAERPQR